TDRFKPPADPDQWKYGGEGDLSSDSAASADSEAAGKARKAFVEGIAALVDGKVKDAEKNLKRATKLLPTFAQAWSGLGQTWEKEANVDQARQAYQRALEAHPDYAQASVRLARIHLVELHDQAALDVTRAAIAQKTSNPFIHFYDAVANTHLKNFEAAE